MYDNALAESVIRPCETEVPAESHRHQAMELNFALDGHVLAKLGKGSVTGTEEVPGTSPRLPPASQGP